jgi:CheY-like chemotaxis protein
MRMPTVDGWQFTRLYRQKPGPHPPIVVLAAARDVAAHAAAIQADDGLGKPFNVLELLELAGQYVRPD